MNPDPIFKGKLLFYSVEECVLCNSLGRLLILNQFEEEYEVDCPACEGKGCLHRYK